MYLASDQKTMTVLTLVIVTLQQMHTYVILFFALLTLMMMKLLLTSAFASCCCVGYDGDQRENADFVVVSRVCQVDRGWYLCCQAVRRISNCLKTTKHQSDGWCHYHHRQGHDADVIKTSWMQSVE
jgi:hypothetical protein